MKKIKYIIYTLIILIASILWGLAVWASSNFDVNVSVIINTLLTPLEGAGMGPVVPAMLSCLPWVLVAILSIIGYVKLDRKQEKKSIKISVGFYFGALLALILVFVFIQYKYDLIGYYTSNQKDTNLYENYYIDPRTVTITAPEKKKNLIYIYMESMETIYADKENGGKQKQNLIPNLTQLAKDNISFSPNGQLGGFNTCEGASWTMGALFTTASGVPFEFPVGDNSMNLQQQFASGIYTMGDFLKEQGYQQMFLCGSEGMFGGRKTFYEQHGAYDVYDYNRAIEEGDIPSDYKVWWGLEDAKLYEIAKKQLQELSEGDAPFNLTMLTVDTHFTSGYVCQLCENSHKVEAANVVECADRQLADFISWIKQQDFYADTTIVITGDHPRMDKFLVKKTEFNDRLIYNCFLNTAFQKEEVNQERQYTAMDVFPTVLAAMGYQIEGDKLGLGSNLFSQKKTLVEERGIEDLNLELMKTSEYYIKHFAPELSYLIEDEFSALEVIYFYGKDYNADQYIIEPLQEKKDKYWASDFLEMKVPLEHNDAKVTIKIHVDGVYNEKQTVQLIEKGEVVYEEVVTGNTVVSIPGEITNQECHILLRFPDAISPHELNAQKKNENKRSINISSITINE